MASTLLVACWLRLAKKVKRCSIYDMKLWYKRELFRTKFCQPIETLRLGFQRLCSQVTLDVIRLGSEQKPMAIVLQFSIILIEVSKTPHRRKKPFVIKLCWTLSNILYFSCPFIYLIFSIVLSSLHLFTVLYLYLYGTYFFVAKCTRICVW